MRRIIILLLAFIIISSMSLMGNGCNVEKATEDTLKLNRILLVEDNPVAQKIGRIQLENHFKCEIDVAIDGTNALALTEQTLYDLIIVDIGLPDMTGFELANEIATRNHKNKNTTIIGLTAHISPPEHHPLNHHIQMLFSKPLTETLCHEINSTIQQSALQKMS